MKLPKRGRIAWKFPEVFEKAELNFQNAKILGAKSIEMIQKNSGFVRVLENLESPGILLWHFPGLERPEKRQLVLESSGNLLNSSSVWKAVRRINIEILGV